MPFISTPFNCLFAVCIVVVCLMLLVDVVNCKRPKNDNSADANERKHAKYEDFKCYGQTLAQNEMEGVVCNPKDKPKGCIFLWGCKMTNGQLDPEGTQKHDLRDCITKQLLAGLRKYEGIDIDADQLCALYVDQANICDGCKVCHPKKGNGDYCNGDGTNGGGTTEGGPDTTEARPADNGADTLLVSILPFGATAIWSIWMRLVFE